MSSGAATTGGGKSKPSGFKKEGNGKWPTLTIQPGQFRKSMLDNIKMLSKASMGTGKLPGKAVTVAPDRGQVTVANLKELGRSKVTKGDNPFKGAKRGN